MKQNIRRTQCRQKSNLPSRQGHPRCCCGMDSGSSSVCLGHALLCGCLSEGVCWELAVAICHGLAPGQQQQQQGRSAEACCRRSERVWGCGIMLCWSAMCGKHALRDVRSLRGCQWVLKTATANTHRVICFCWALSERVVVT